jgi:hypothetical protein
VLYKPELLQEKLLTIYSVPYVNMFKVTVLAKNRSRVRESEEKMVRRKNSRRT